MKRGLTFMKYFLHPYQMRQPQDAKDFSCCNYASCLFFSLLELYLVILLHFANADLFPSLYSAAIFFFFNPYPALEP
jgi:restriction endonuclease S subunit